MTLSDNILNLNGFFFMSDTLQDVLKLVRIITHRILTETEVCASQFVLVAKVNHRFHRNHNISIYM